MNYKFGVALALRNANVGILSNMLRGNHKRYPSKQTKVAGIIRLACFQIVVKTGSQVFVLFLALSQCLLRFRLPLTIRHFRSLPVRASTLHYQIDSSKVATLVLDPSLRANDSSALINYKFSGILRNDGLNPSPHPVCPK